MIESARYMEKGHIVAVIDGKELHIPNDLENRHRQELSAWEAEGHEIAPYEEPEPTIPDTVSSRQFFLQLDAAGLTVAVNTWVLLQSAAIKIALNKSAAFHRSDEMLQLGFASMGFSTEEVDAFFLAASKR